MEHIKLFEEFDDSIFEDDITTFDGDLGTINIKIDGDHKYKLRITSEIKKVLRSFQGERHLFIDDVEVNPYK